MLLLTLGKSLWKATYEYAEKKKKEIEPKAPDEMFLLM